MTQTGLLQWANSVRLTMATDPGRQLFQEQVHTHGFLFLDDYLGNIISGAKQDPLIELVKTPSRKKAIAVKPKLTSKLTSVVTLSLEDDVVKESSAPVDTFHKTLLDAHLPSHGSDYHTLNDMKPPHDTQIDDVSDPSLVPDTFISPHGDDKAVANTYSTHSGELASTSHLEQNELSIIAEDDETVERTRMSIQISHTSPPQVAVIGGYTPHPTTYDDAPADAMTSSTGTSDSIQLCDAAAVEKDDGLDESELSLPRRRSSLVEVQVASDPMVLESPIITNFRTNIGSASSDIVGDIDVPIRDPDADSELIHRAAVPVFPSLPEPMPLRKSIKSLRDHSMGAPTLYGTTTPGATLTGKRTSWLMKAREAKASEGTSKKASSSGHFTTTASQTPGMSSKGSLKRKSGDMSNVPRDGLEDGERKPKALKTADANMVPFKAQISNPEQIKNGEGMGISGESSAPIHSASDIETDSVLDLLKRTVEDLTRHGKPIGKSFDSNAVNALAEARAAAEARIAERNQKEDEMTLGLGVPAVQQGDSTRNAEAEGVKPALSSSSGIHERLSISDLFPTDSKMKEKHKVPGKGKGQSLTYNEHMSEGRESTSTTPPNSPPRMQSSSFVLPSGPIFNKPPPVFVAPVISQQGKTLRSNKDTHSRFNTSGPFSKPVPMTMGITPRLPSPKNTNASIPAPLTAHSTLESMKSDKIFDDDNDSSAWMPSTQDTEYSTAYDNQAQTSHNVFANEVDDDDSWPMDDKVAAGTHWAFGVPMNRDDSLTWSTLPSQGQPGDTETLNKEYERSSSHFQGANSRELGATHLENNGSGYDKELEEAELEEAILGADMSTVKFVETHTTRSASVMSTASSASSQSQGGFFSQATKLLSSALGTSKKGKPEVKKVLQMAAVAAKKQQEEADKKAARLKEMENRRLAALQRKAEEEKIRALEEERKLKEEGERRKRDRDDTDKRPPKGKIARKDEDTTKKRKIEAEKKPELKKPMPIPNTKAATAKPSQKPPSALASSAAYNSSSHIDSSASNSKGSEPSKLPKIVPASAQKNKVKLTSNKPTVPEDDDSQPSQVLKTQMAARAKAQIQAAKHTGQPVIPSESIELPDINSEYSDSDDEDRPKTFDPPDWAQSPELRQALQMQSTINPDDIFGTVRPLKMEEIFKTRTSRFRARTSSANWTGSDRLTQEEEMEYARRMGFR
ncbi:hypothetical protein BDQ17DRAFT_1294706 [Cyathus striatus]|nr:hypothetical protein BDQ17DRAFT_1294706 [Cyathus striatus]